MKKISLLLISLIIVVSLIFSSSVYASGVPQEVLNASSSVVYIEVKSAIEIGSGSGFIVKNGSDGTYIVTNNHVIESNPAGVSVWIGKDEKRSATVVEHSEELDLAVLKLAEPISANALTLSNNAEQGDEVFAVGYPAAADYLSNTEAHLSSEATITNGIISSIRTTKIVDYGPEVKLLQINADINAGNSGGPLLNAKGRVIGINSYGALESQGIFGAISASELIGFINDNNLFQINTDETSSSDWLIYCLIGLLIAAILSFIFIPKLRNLIVRMFSSLNKKETGLNEYLSGLDKPLDAYSVVSLIMPTMLELRDRHMQGSVYLKLAPSGIVVTKNGFKLHESEETASDEFFAPEIREGKFAGIKADIYEVCALIKYVLNYNCPSSAIEEPEPGSAESELIRIINKGLENKAEDRYGNMQDLISELSPFNRGISDRILQPLNEIKRISKEEKQADIVTKTEWIIKPKKKRKPVLIIVIAACGLLLAFVIFSAVNYFSAINCASNYDFEEAYTYINNVAFSKDIFADNYCYIDAGYDMANRNYDSAIQKLESYRNQSDGTVTLIKEAKYRKAAMLADQCSFDESVALYIEISGYKDSAQLVNDTKFRHANYYISKEKYMDALNILQELSRIRYPEADETAMIVKDIIYNDAISNYHNGQYNTARVEFETIGSYLRSKDYLVLIGVRGFELYFNSKELWPLIGFEDAADLIMSNHFSAKTFLTGTWKGGSKYLKIKDDGHIEYNLPYISGDYYKIENGLFLVYNKKSPEKTQRMWEVTIIDKDCIIIFAYKNSTTYTLYRQ